jgi:oligosaccharyltransferase complex subunit beta
LKSYHSGNINLISYGEYNYDHLLLFASSDDELKSFKPKEITEFFDSGRNIVILGNVDQNRAFRHLVNAFGVDMHELGSSVYDHFNNLNP